MKESNGHPQERLDIALERIAAEKAARTGRLDLGNLGLTRLPDALRELDFLEELTLDGVVEFAGRAYRQSEDGSREETDEAYNPNRLGDIASLSCSELQSSSPRTAIIGVF